MAQSQLIYGMHSVLAALKTHPEKILVLYCDDKSPNRFDEILQAAKRQQISPQFLSKSKLDKLVGSTHHQGIAVKLKSQSGFDAKQLLQWLETTEKKPLLLILDGIQDPHNMGACLRSAQALGVDFVIVPKANSAPLNATVSKVSCGADQMLPVVQVSNLVRFIEDIKQLGVWIIGTDASAKQTVAQIDFTRKVALVMGSEGAGMKRLTLEACDDIVGIPLQGEISSLNVSVATGICLYECLRQRKLGSKA